MNRRAQQRNDYEIKDIEAKIKGITESLETYRKMLMGYTGDAIGVRRIKEKIFEGHKELVRLVRMREKRMQLEMDFKKEGLR